MERSRRVHDDSPTRRAFVQAAVATASASLFGAVVPKMAAAEPPPGDRTCPAFVARGNEFPFDTGTLRGMLRSGGQSRGLLPLVDCSSGATIARGTGIFSHYRLLDADHRYGHAAWDWSSQSRVLPGGSVEVVWSADEEHPFEMTAVYRWATENILDVTTRVVPRQDVRRFEVFLASYFQGFPVARVRVQGGPENGGQPGFLAAQKSRGVWQMFPRDEAARQIIGDGRWQRPPNPVNWTIMPQLAAPLALRRDEATGLTGVVMAPPDDCFAVSTPYSEEGHRSLYLSMLGRDIKAGQPAVARARLVIGREISDARAIALYEQYLAQIRHDGDSSAPVLH